MAYLQYSKASITGIASCYPQTILESISASSVLTENEAKKIIKATGIKERRIASEGVCASDLCFQAANNLMDSLDVDRESIDVLIFLSQTPDYLCVPATACVLQDRLGLSSETAAFDMTLGCSGLIFALSTAYSYVEAGASRVLLLVGETMSKFTSYEDRTTALLFGDAASALLIENTGKPNPSYFSLRTNGAGHKAIQIPNGGYRNPIDAESLQVKTFEDGSRRSGQHVTMDGMKVFDFTMKEVVKNIKDVIAFAGSKIEDIDMFALHQANKFMLDMFAKKLEIPTAKMPISIDRFGNTSTVSIPLTMTDALSDEDSFPKNTIMCGYGAGLSWGSALVNMSDCKLYNHFEYKKEN